MDPNRALLCRNLVVMMKRSLRLRLRRLLRLPLLRLPLLLHEAVVN
jgi:hypothetical protein